MKRCKVYYTTFMGGKSSRVEFFGTVSYEKEITVRYQDGQDEVELRFSKEGASVSRKGLAFLSLNFPPTGEGVMSLKGGDTEVYTPILMEKYALKQTLNKIEVLLNYSICYPRETQKFFVRIQVIASLEEK